MSEKKILATVNGREITQQDVDMLLGSLDPQRAMQFQTEQGKQRLLEELINQELFYFDAIENKLDQQDEFKQEVEKLKNNMLKEFAITRVLNKINIDDQEIEKYYNENKEQFKSEESVKASHILVDDEVKAQKVLNEINEGVSFEEAAQKHSKCPSNAKGGDLGYFTQGKMIPEFEQAAFNMNVGELSKPIKTQFGYHLIKLIDRKKAGMSTLDEVRAQIKQNLIAMKQNKAYLNKCNELKNKYPVEMKI